MTYHYLQKVSFRPSALAGFSESRSAEDRVYEGDLESVFRVLDGPSRWQPYIRKNLAIARRHLPAKPFRILNLRDYTNVLSQRGVPGNERNIPGFTDKQTGEITMLEWGPNTGFTFLSAALHETVHLVSHPAQQGSANSTAYGFLGQGFLEGIVECVTIDVLRDQRIALAKSELRGHQDRLRVAVQLLSTLSIPLMARVLFEGDLGQFREVVHHTYSVNGWNEIQTLTTENKSALAIQRMNYWRAQQEQVHRYRLQQLIQQIPGRRP